LGFSDDYYWSHLIANEIYGRMLTLDFTNNAIKDLIKNEVREAFGYAYTWYRDEVLRRRAGITIDEYLHDPKLVPALRKKAAEILYDAAKDVPAEMIIIGQTHRGPILLRANGEELNESTEFVVSGAGADAALNWFRLRDQRNNYSPARSLFHMMEAKRFCQLDPSIGRQTQIVYLPPTGEALTFQDDGVTTLKSWMDSFGIRDTSELDEETARDRFERGVREAAISRR
jgi:hypothetical protein